MIDAILGLCAARGGLFTLVAEALDGTDPT